MLYPINRFSRPNENYAFGHFFFRKRRTRRALSERRLPDGVSVQKAFRRDKRLVAVKRALSPFLPSNFYVRLFIRPFDGDACIIMYARAAVQWPIRDDGRPTIFQPTTMDGKADFVARAVRARVCVGENISREKTEFAIRARCARVPRTTQYTLLFMLNNTGHLYIYIYIYGRIAYITVF